MFRLSSTLLCCCVLLLFSCKKNKQIPEPLQNVIAGFTACNCEPYINEYKWEKKTVYMLAYKGTTCNWEPLFYDKKGNAMELPPEYSYGRFLHESELISNTWTCKQ